MNGYESVAPEFMAARSAIGRETIQAWARLLPAGSQVLDLGCGHGIPVSKALVDTGLTVFGIDTSPSLIATFRDRFPTAEVACEPLESSNFFGRTFDAIIAVGLMFLLHEEAQRSLIPRVAQALNPGGRFLFTAPKQCTTWNDTLTGQESISLGAPAYKMLLAEAGLELAGEYEDDGGNHYYDSVLRASLA